MKGLLTLGSEFGWQMYDTMQTQFKQLEAAITDSEVAFDACEIWMLPFSRDCARAHPMSVWPSTCARPSRRSS